MREGRLGEEVLEGFEHEGVGALVGVAEVVGDDHSPRFGGDQVELDAVGAEPVAGEERLCRVGVGDERRSHVADDRGRGARFAEPRGLRDGAALFVRGERQGHDGSKVHPSPGGTRGLLAEPQRWQCGHQ